MADSPLFASIARFATLCDVNEKTVDRWLRAGLPSIGRGRERRVDVQLAVEWLRGHSRNAIALAEDGPTAEARRLATRLVERKTKAR